MLRSPPFNFASSTNRSISPLPRSKFFRVQLRTVPCVLWLVPPHALDEFVASPDDVAPSVATDSQTPQAAEDAPGSHHRHHHQTVCAPVLHVTGPDGQQHSLRHVPLAVAEVSPSTKTPAMARHPSGEKDRCSCTGGVGSRGASSAMQKKRRRTTWVARWPFSDSAVETLWSLQVPSNVCESVDESPVPPLQDGDVSTSKLYGVMLPVDFKPPWFLEDNLPELYSTPGPVSTRLLAIAYITPPPTSTTIRDVKDEILRAVPLLQTPRSERDIVWDRRHEQILQKEGDTENVSVEPSPPASLTEAEKGGDGENNAHETTCPPPHPISELLTLDPGVAEYLARSPDGEYPYDHRQPPWPSLVLRDSDPLKSVPNNALLVVTMWNKLYF